jgi:hypothetical protein
MVDRWAGQRDLQSVDHLVKLVPLMAGTRVSLMVVQRVHERVALIAGWREG